MKRFAKQEFDPHISPTIGVDFMPAAIDINGSSYSLSLWNDRCVSKAEGRQLARQSSMLFVETSALTSENVNACFQELVSYIVTSPAYSELRSSPDSKETLHLGDSSARSNRGSGICGAC
ncbi:unnamed protein product [Schistocephalus solidus]|uniref:Ras-related protein RABH1b n=1 Tax=Schistocephalus solidus TaxID=70667 RepID=A0A183SJX3_SCHSO|nr:unnamed protein product [Schistocephalus solidus]